MQILSGDVEVARTFAGDQPRDVHTEGGGDGLNRLDAGVGSLPALEARQVAAGEPRLLFETLGRDISELSCLLDSTGEIHTQKIPVARQACQKCAYEFKLSHR